MLPHNPLFRPLSPVACYPILPSTVPLDRSLSTPPSRGLLRPLLPVEEGIQPVPSYMRILRNRHPEECHVYTKSQAVDWFYAQCQQDHSFRLSVDVYLPKDDLFAKAIKSHIQNSGLHIIILAWKKLPDKPVFRAFQAGPLIRLNQARSRSSLLG